MNPDQLRQEIMTRLRAAKPVTFDQALAIGKTVLAADPKASQQFEKWFEVNGATVVQMVNHV